MEAFLPRGLKRGPFGIPEPDPSSSVRIPPEEIDLVICPGTAFDELCSRVGMGGGYYDTFLPKAERAVRIAAAFQCQITEDIPRLPHDCGVDWIVTEQGVFKVNKK